MALERLQSAYARPLKLLRQPMGPDMLVSYVLSCDAIRELVSGKVFLDVGGWGGELQVFAAAQARLSVALNIRRSHLLAGERLAKSLGLDNIALVQGDAQRLPFGSGTVDVVLTAHTMEHVPDYKAAMREIRRVLKDDGHLVVILPNAKVFSGYSLSHPTQVWRALRRRSGSEVEHVPHYQEASYDGPAYHGWEHAFDTRFFARFLQDEGFHILEEKQGFLLSTGLMLPPYLFASSTIPRSVIKLVRLLTLPLSIVGKKASTPAAGHDGRVEAPPWMKKAFTRPRNLLKLLHPVYIVVDRLERRLRPGKEGGLFLIHARKKGGA